MSNQRSNNSNNRNQRRRARRRAQRKIKQQYMIDQMSQRLAVRAGEVVENLYQMIGMIMDQDNLMEDIDSSCDNPHATDDNRIITFHNGCFETSDDCIPISVQLNQEFEHGARIASQVTGQSLSHWGVK